VPKFEVFDCFGALGYGMMRALLEHGERSTREAPHRGRATTRHRRAPKPQAEPAIAAQASPVPELDASAPAPPLTQAQYDRMEAILRGEAPIGYYKPHEGAGAGDGVS